MKPYSAEEWNTYYFNTLLCSYASYESEYISIHFDTESKLHEHQLYKLLVKYQDAQKNIKLARMDIHDHRIKSRQLFNQIWDVKKHVVRKTGKCKDFKSCRTEKEFE